MKLSLDKLNILVLHSLGDIRAVPFFLKHHVFILERSSPGHNYLYHDTTLPLPQYIKDTPFDLIVLDVTLLCGRWLPTKTFERLKSEYSFVKDSNAVKIAFPQERPEILPFASYPTAAFLTYEDSWKKHETELQNIFL